MSAFRSFNPSKLGAPELETLRHCIEQHLQFGHLRLSGALRGLASDALAKSKANLREHLLAVASSLLADLAEQSWDIRLQRGQIEIRPPSSTPTAGENVASVKERIRRGLMLASDRQLATKSASDFLASMDRDRVFNNKIVSIKSVLDDGRSLVRAINITQSELELREAKALRKVINPFIQLCEPDALCPKTGLKLQDIWRYCRYSWSLEYNPTPGRTLRFLIRNKARPNWPIMGIAMLASPAANYYVRDKWIGWSVDDLANQIVSGIVDPKQIGLALQKTIADAISELRTDDLCNDGEIENPRDDTFFRLLNIVRNAGLLRQADLIERHNNDTLDGRIDIRGYDKAKLLPSDWKVLSETSLFRKKRAESLYSLLKCRRYMIDSRFAEAPGAAVCEALMVRQGQEQIAFALNELRKRRLASEIADLSVCGAVPPYNHILSGKLVALLMSSREVSAMYESRYQNQVSEIASQMAGRPITRPAKLKVLTTTSLYGVSSSQYNRLVIRSGIAKSLKSDLIWQELDQTQGMTVTHLSKLTLSYMIKLAVAQYGARRVNSVFGEGSSPRTRQIREGLNLLGISNDNILKQGLTRRVYACELYPGAREELRGLKEANDTRSPPRADAVVEAWMVRWAIPRLNRSETLAQMAQISSDHLPSQLQTRAQLGAAAEFAADTVTDEFSSKGSLGD